MATKQKIEVFSSGCPLCNEAIDLVRQQAGLEAEIIVHSMTDARGFGRATALGVRSVPAIAIELDTCCLVRTPSRSNWLAHCDLRHRRQLANALLANTQANGSAADYECS
jgi:hypothetical protein